MGNREQLQTALKEFGNTIGLPDLALNEEGYCCLSFDEKIVVNLQFQEETGSVLLFAGLGEIREEARTEMYEQMLEANLFWQGTGNGTLGIEPGSRVAILACREPTAGMSLVRFEKMVEEFINTAEYWMDLISRNEPPSDGTSQTNASNAPPYDGIRA